MFNFLNRLFKTSFRDSIVNNINIGIVEYNNKIYELNCLYAHNITMRYYIDINNKDDCYFAAQFEDPIDFYNRFKSYLEQTK